MINLIGQIVFRSLAGLLGVGFVWVVWRQPHIKYLFMLPLAAVFMAYAILGQAAADKVLTFFRPDLAPRTRNQKDDGRR